MFLFVIMVILSSMALAINLYQYGKVSQVPVDGGFRVALLVFFVCAILLNWFYFDPMTNDIGRAIFSIYTGLGIFSFFNIITRKTAVSKVGLFGVIRTSINLLVVIVFYLVFK